MQYGSYRYIHCGKGQRCCKKLFPLNRLNLFTENEITVVVLKLTDYLCLELLQYD